MRHVSQNVNQNVYETGSTFGKIDPLGQAHVRLDAEWNRSSEPAESGVATTTGPERTDQYRRLRFKVAGSQTSKNQRPTNRWVQGGQIRGSVI